jgi:prevent-host-death family protein
MVSANGPSKGFVQRLAIKDCRSKNGSYLNAVIAALNIAPAKSAFQRLPHGILSNWRKRAWLIAIRTDPSEIISNQPVDKLVDWCHLDKRCFMPTEIGSFEAKTKFSELIRKAEQGETFTITLRGRVVAQIVPPEPVRKPVPRDVIDRLMHPKIHGISGDEVLAAIREGRR